jgi:Domain of unknown function (DUF1707)/2TM domain
MPDASHRASDAEREAVADRLRGAAAEGRLDADELEERLGRAYGARTIGDLAPLTADLPAAAPVGAAVPVPPRLPALHGYHVRRRLATFITVNVICIAIWAASGTDGSFWPIWVILGTGIGLFSTVVKALLGVDEDEDDDYRGRRRERLGDARHLRR